MKHGERGMTPWEAQFDSLAYQPCGHVRHKVSEGEDNGVVIEAWRCDVCDNVLLERRDDA